MSYLITVSDSVEAKKTLSKIETYNSSNELSFRADELSDLDVISSLKFIAQNAAQEFVSTITPADFVQTVNKFMGF